MADVYARLARKLDRLPHGFPATASGVELRILRKIFSPDDARLALELDPVPATAETIAGRLRLPVEQARSTLDAMAHRGQIGSFTMAGTQRYALMPFVIGIWEFQLPRLDAELAALYEEYAPHLVRTVGGRRPALARVVPVHASIDVRLSILGYEDMRGIIRQARSFALRECICRKERALQGHPCAHTLETCLAFSPEERAFDYFNYAGRVISSDEALRLLDVTEEEGLVHATYNVREQPMFVCNCCTCCCGFLRGLREFGAPHLLARSGFAASIDTATCSACAACVSPRCPMDAIVHDDGAYRVIAERCLGCGVCAVACPSGSIRLVRRSEPEPPPRDILDWSVDRLGERGGPLTRLALRFWRWRHARPLGAGPLT